MKTAFYHIKKTFTYIILFLLLPTHAAAQWPGLPECDTYMFVQRDTALYLDVYRPEKPRQDKAAVMTLFGGGFFKGERNNRQQKQTAQALLERGFTVISIDYRLGLKDSAMVARNATLFKATGLFKYCIDIAVQDCAAAVAWVCSNADRLDIDPSRLILTGSSAGAITVLQLDYYRANSMKEASALPDGWKPAAVVAYSGAVFCERTKPKYATPPVPTFFLHGDKDRIVNFKKFPPVLRTGLYGPKKLHKVFEKNNYPHWFFKFEGIGHEVAAIPQYMFEEMESFVDKTLRGAEMYYDATVRDNSIQPTEWSKLDVSDLYKR